MEQASLKAHPRQCTAITHDGTRCRNTRMRGGPYCFQHYPKKLLISQMGILLAGAILGVFSSQVYDSVTTSMEERQLAAQESLLVNQSMTISSLQERNTLLERQISEFGRYVQTTPEGTIIIGKPTGSRMKVAPGASVTISENPDFACNVGWGYLQEGKLAAAQELFLQSLAADSSHYRANLYFAVSLLAQGKYAKARVPAEKALAHVPDKPNERKMSLFVLGLVLKALDENDRSVALFDSVLAVDPDYVLALDAKRRIDSPIEFPLGKVKVTIP